VLQLQVQCVAAAGAALRYHASSQLSLGQLACVQE